MGIKIAISNTDPIIHLSEIGCFHCLRIVDNLLIPKSVESEVRRKNAPGKNELRSVDWITTKELEGAQKEKADKIAKDFGIELAISFAQPSLDRTHISNIYIPSILT